MKWIDNFYKTKSLRDYGIIISVVLVVLLLFAPLFITEFSPNNSRQIFSINGKHLKYNDQAILDDFLLSIKKHNNYLCLGTSESTSVKGGNYFNFLNNDKDLKSSLSVLAGAGRTCGMHIPMLLQHKKQVEGLNLIYFINPVYWRQDLCKVDKEYWNRYNSYASCSSISPDEENAENFKVVEEYFETLNFGEKSILWLEDKIRNLRRPYFQDLYYGMDSSKYYESLSYVAQEKVSLETFNKFGQINTEEIDTVWNIDRTFKHKEWFKPIDTSVDYRYRELSSFIRICKNLGVKATFILGPVNERFINNYSASSLSGYSATIENIKNLLSDEEAAFIDATDISNKAGAFLDHQHHSSYGAYLIYLKLKKYLNEKMGD